MPATGVAAEAARQEMSEVEQRADGTTVNATEMITERDQRSGWRALPVAICDVEQMFSEALAHLLWFEGFATVEVAATFDADGRHCGRAADAAATAVHHGDRRPRAPRSGSPAQLGAMRQLADRTLLVVVTRDRDPRMARVLATAASRAFLTRD